METKLCTVCGEIKTLDHFTKIKNSNRYRHMCHECRKEKYRENPTQSIERSKRYYIKNKSAVLKERKKRYSENYEKVLLNSAKDRATKKGLPFDIGIEDITIPEICPVLGVRLEHGNGKSIAASPTLDRIVPEKGYVKGNIMVISHRANTIKGDASPEELIRVAKFYENIQTK